MRPLHTNPRIWIAALYLLFGALWILFSDLLLSNFVSDPAQLTQIQLYKGWAFILVTTVLLYLLIGNLFRKKGIVSLTLPGLTTDAPGHTHSLEYLNLAHAVYERSHDGITITDLQGRIIAVNPAFTTITGYTENDVLGKDASILQSGYHSDEFYHEIRNMLTSQDFWAGEVWKRRKDGKTFPVWLSINAIRDDSGKLIYFIHFFSDLSRLKHSEELLLYHTNHDPLTNLPNQRMFHARLEQAIAQAKRHGYMLAVLMLDLDSFKDINDSLGMKVGDKLLQDVAQRITQCVRAEDIVARHGGDELLIALNEIHEPNQVLEVTDKIRNVLRQPSRITAHEIFLTASIGISLYPENGATPELLIRNADAALYRAKEEGSDQLAFYSESFSHTALERLTILSGLRNALEQHELELHYQPQIYSQSRELAGVEALIRWRHPEKGLILPDNFIPVAEQGGLIRDIGNWVLHEACRQLAEWRDHGIEIPRVAINLSAKQLVNGDLIKTLEALLQEFRLDPAMLELELTESEIMTNPDEAARILAATSALGFPLAIDDFGTGYSSLSYLQRLHPQRLKIDRTFVKGLPEDSNSVAICQAVIAMANRLGMETVAEGVEERPQCDFLRQESCTIYQGWLIAKAMPAAELETWLGAQ